MREQDCLWGGAIWDVVEEEVVGLRYVDIVLYDALLPLLHAEELQHGPRAVDHLKATSLIKAELRHRDSGHVLH